MRDNCGMIRRRVAVPPTQSLRPHNDDPTRRPDRPPTDCRDTDARRLPSSSELISIIAE